MFCCLSGISLPLFQHTRKFPLLPIEDFYILKFLVCVRHLVLHVMCVQLASYSFRTSESKRIGACGKKLCEQCVVLVCMFVCVSVFTKGSRLDSENIGRIKHLKPFEMLYTIGGVV